MAVSTVASIKRYFRKVWDPRVQGRTRHLLVDILVMAICGVIADCNSWEEVVVFAEKRQSWFKRFLKLPHGIPSHDTFERVFNRVDPKVLESCLVAWLKDINGLLGLPQIAIDGKSLRHSYHHRKGLAMLHSVSAWASQQQLVLGQVMTDAKSNEITAIPRLLELLDLKGALVTIDAMGCQKAIAKQIVDQQGAYVLVVKENHEHLLDDIQATVEKALEGELPAKDVQHFTSREQNKHGREEVRSYTAIHNVEGIRQRDQWEKLTSVGICYSERTVGGRTSYEVRYFIGSRRMSARAYGKALRDHWDIENNLHWHLDVHFGEDANRTHRRHAGTNLAALRRVALSLLKQNPSKKSIAVKRKEASLDTDFLEEILTGARNLENV
jgi:predicted transposase YbfD/YdcC